MEVDLHEKIAREYRERKLKEMIKEFDEYDEKHPILNKLFSLATTASIILGGFYLAYRILTPEYVKEAKVESIEYEEAYDGETGYSEVIKFVELDSYNGCVIDKKKYLREGDNITDVKIRVIPIPFVCDHLIEYKIVRNDKERGE
jgi:hypothetical protein